MVHMFTVNSHNLSSLLANNNQAKDLCTHTYGLHSIRPGKLKLVLTSSENCRLNCYYCLPSNDTPTFNSRTAVYLPSIYSACY